MHKKMLIDSDPHETRIAILEQDRLAEIFIERRQDLGIVGNVYLGRVNRVLPGMQAAFVDIGLERDAFLYVDEVADPLAPIAGLDDRAEAAVPGDEESSAELFPISAERSAALAERTIEALLRPGQGIMVQVLKDALPNKGARVSTQITLPGRSLVLLPDVAHLGVSRRIEDEAERERLRALAEDLRPADAGLIVRTAGAEADREEFEADLAYLQLLWQKIRARSETLSAPVLLHRDLDLSLRVVRDYLSEDFAVVWVDGEGTYERVVEFVDQVKPSLLNRVKLYQDSALFDRFAVEAEIEAALKTKIWLKSGGYIVIHPTEALVAIDVNTGRYVGRHNLEDTVLTTNLEAVEEIVRQIRLRNLGGILVIDLIDMVDADHRQEVLDALVAEMAKDRAKHKILEISEFGLVEITRKRSRPSLERLLTQPCPYCRGVGRVKSLSTIGLDLRRQVLQQARGLRHRELLLRVHPEVAEALQRQDQPILRELERELQAEILVKSDPGLHHERFDILEV
jgi:ribonuclease G